DELQQIRSVFHGLQTSYQTYLSKVDPSLIDDLLVRELEDKSPSLPPFYIVEIKTMQGTDQEKMKAFVLLEKIPSGPNRLILATSDDDGNTFQEPIAPK
ncbi:MAG TPA: hypothetical protein VE130_00575, partial [Nitrososphaeraceae archaeon]|nr:hypothetical protein [Nitrososphaeraceae archaeon]